MSAEEPLHENIEIDQAHLANLDQLMELITTKFHYVIIDVSRHFPVMWRYFSRHSSTIFLVGGLSITSLRDTLRISGVLNEEKDAKTQAIIVNHIREKDTVKFNRFQELIGRKVDVEIGYHANASEAADLGAPLALKNHSYRVDVNKIIEIITGVHTRKNQAPFLKKIAQSLMGR